MNVIVTGGCGFIGSHLVDLLVQEGHQVAVVDLRADAAVNWNHVQNLLVRSDGHLLLGDCGDSAVLDAALATLGTVDLVFHLAAQSHVCRSLDAPLDTFHDNACVTLSVALWCSRHGVPLEYACTDEVYGDMEDQDSQWQWLGADEYRTPIRPSSPYSASKAAGELAILSVHRSFGLRAVITRGSNAFGPRQYGEKLFPIACRLLRQGQSVPLHGGAQWVRQWIAVEETARGIALAGKYVVGEQSPTRFPAIFNLAGPRLARICDVVDAVGKLIRPEWAGSQSYGASYPNRPGQDCVYHVDGRRAEQILGFKAARDILAPEELRRLVDAYPLGGEVVLPRYVGGEGFVGR